MKKTAKAIALFWGALTVPLWAQGTYTAKSCSQSDVNSVINGPTHTAVDGDIIEVPAGSCTWASGIIVPIGVGITISGTGAPTGGAGNIGASSSCTATAITDNIAGGGPAFLLQPTYTSSLSRISCLKIFGQGSTNSLYSPIAVQGRCNSSACPNLRIDNVTFDGSLQTLILNSGTVIVTDNVFGVLDHNSMSGRLGIQGIEFINYNNSAWNGLGAYGDNSWASTGSFGTSKTLYLENNSWGAGVVIGETESSVPNGGEGGGRIAARFNSCNGCLSGVSNHGTESNGRARGGRQIEFYGNSFVCTSTAGGCQGAVPTRSGVTYVFGNSLTAGVGSWFNQYVAFSTYRTLQAFSPWGACDGTGAFDINDGAVYASGTFTGVSIVGGITATVADATKAWSSNQWIPAGAPYAIHDITTGAGAQVTGSGINTITASGWTGAPNFNIGDSYQILRASACIDQPNRSGGTLLSGATPNPTGANSQTLDPSYEWNDTGYNPVFGNVTASSGAQIIANRDWYTDDSHGSPRAQSSPTSPFNGARGVGFGTLANRPSTCTPKVAYWASDQGNWNSSGNGFGQGQLFVCTSANTWTLLYTPYTYPHPLTAAGAPSSNVTVNPPTNLQVVVR